MGLGDITRKSVLSAIAEYDRVGEQELINQHGFHASRNYWLIHKHKTYVSKAVGNLAQAIGMGVPLRRTMWIAGGGALVRRLRTLGFEVIEGSRPTLVKTSSPASPPASTANPDWSRDELILALDLYLRSPRSPPGKSSAEVAELSAILARLAKMNGVTGNDKFRNANGVYMKMMNFRRFDPTFKSAGKSGMTSGGKLDKVIWDEFAGQQSELRAAARTIRDALGNPILLQQLTQVGNDGEDSADEGGVSYRLHRIYERNQALRNRKKKQVLTVTGALRCEVCSFDFGEYYGEHGDGFIEVHHTKPVHKMKLGDKTMLDDLAVLCANCHRMVHKQPREPLSLESLKSFLQNPVQPNV